MYSFPSGVVLYWSVNDMLSSHQQYIVNRAEDRRLSAQGRTRPPRSPNGNERIHTGRSRELRRRRPPGGGPARDQPQGPRGGSRGSGSLGELARRIPTGEASRLAARSYVASRRRGAYSRERGAPAKL